MASAKNSPGTPSPEVAPAEKSPGTSPEQAPGAIPSSRSAVAGQAAGKAAGKSPGTSGEEGEKAKKKISFRDAWGHASELLWARRYRLAVGFVLLIVNRAAGLVLPGSSKFLIDEVIGKQQTEALTWLLPAIVAATLVQTASGFALAVILGIAAQRSINDLRRKVQRHVSRLPVGYFDDHKSGELISRIMTDAEGIRNLVGTGFVQLIGGLLSAAVAIGVLFWLSWRMTLLILVVMLIFGVMMVFGFNRLRPIFRQRNQIMAETTGRLAEALGGIRVVKAYSAERRESRIFTHNTHRLLRNIIKTMMGVSVWTSATGLLVGLAGTLIAAFGVHEIVAVEPPRMTLGDLVMYLIFTTMAVAPLVEISAIGTQITEAFAGLDRIREILGMTNEQQGEKQRRPLGRIHGDVEFEDVSFEYKPDTPVLRGVSFLAPAGTTTALVGPSGSGKSTLISLVMAFNQPKSGRILVDGHDLAKVRLGDYRTQLGIVLQDNFLFDGTVRANIAYSRPHATLEEIQAAARIAHCDEFIEEFEDGYDTVIGERGVKVSGGQRQRLAIARAVLADPRLLILDEATSSLDSESEEKIQDGLATLLEGRTTFVIAHRLSTIVNADQILVLQDGRIVEKGRHEDLLEENGLYRTLYDKQYRLERNRFINPGEEVQPVEPRKQPRPTVRAGDPRSL